MPWLISPQHDLLIIIICVGWKRYCVPCSEILSFTLFTAQVHFCKLWETDVTYGICNARHGWSVSAVDRLIILTDEGIQYQRKLFLNETNYSIKWLWICWKWKEWKWLESSQVENSQVLKKKNHQQTPNGSLPWMEDGVRKAQSSPCGGSEKCL